MLDRPSPQPAAFPAQPPAGSGAPSSAGRAWQRTIPTSVAPFAWFGLAIVGIFLGGFAVWASTAPIGGAAVGAGVVAASGLNQKVDHLEGGVVSKILVNEGDAVKAGDVLLTLDTTRSQADRDRLLATLVGLKAKLARTAAEREGAETLAFPADVVDQAREFGMSDTLEEQRKEFSNRLDRMQSERAVLVSRKEAVNDEILGLESQLESEQRKNKVLHEEIGQKKRLLDKGLTPRSTYNALVREEADSSGRIGALKASIAQQRTSLLELEKEELRLTAARREEAAGEYNATAIQIPDTEERLRASEDILARSEVRSPVDGIVVKLAKNTVGSTARPGETLAEILPTSSGLIIESRILPQDIDVVRPGQKASVRFVALNTRTTPDADATVTYVSADRLVDQQSQQSYYVARLALTEDLPPPLTRDKLYPGMPVETFISTGDRTFFEYLVKPLSDSFNRAFREN